MFIKLGHSRHLFALFMYFLFKYEIGRCNVVPVGIRAANLRCQMRPPYQLSHITLPATFSVTFLFIMCFHNNTTKNTQDTVAKKKNHRWVICKRFSRNGEKKHFKLSFIRSTKNDSKMHPSKKMKKKSCHLFRPRHLSHYFLIDSFSGEFQLQ